MDYIHHFLMFMIFVYYRRSDRDAERVLLLEPELMALKELNITVAFIFRRILAKRASLLRSVFDKRYSKFKEELNSLEFQVRMYDLETLSLRNGIREATTEAEVREIGLRLEDVKTELEYLQNRLNVVAAQIPDLEY